MDGKYLVYRVYTKEERPDLIDRSVFYGWSTNKNIIKAFRKQRSGKKYRVIKMSEEEIAKTFSEDIDDIDAMIDFIKLKSSQTNEIVYLFMTLNEMRETEKKILKMFVDKASLEDIPGNGNYLQMFLSIDEYYSEALYYIGYRPREVDILFPSADYHDEYSNPDRIDDLVDDAYDSMYGCPQDELRRAGSPVVSSNVEDVASKIVFSIESFIKILRDDM